VTHFRVPVHRRPRTESPSDVTIQVAEVTDAESFPEANTPALGELALDLGDDGNPVLVIPGESVPLGGELY
jgi:tRNA-binding protein